VFIFPDKVKDMAELVDVEKKFIEEFTNEIGLEICYMKISVDRNSITFFVKFVGTRLMATITWSQNRASEAWHNRVRSLNEDKAFSDEVNVEIEDRRELFKYVKKNMKDYV